MAGPTKYDDGECFPLELRPGGHTKAIRHRSDEEKLRALNAEARYLRSTVERLAECLARLAGVDVENLLRRP